MDNPTPQETNLSLETITYKQTNVASWCTKRMSIVIRFQLDGLHCFPGVENMMANQVDQLDVSFLKHPHRHKFFFEVEIPVSHDNRELEFFQVKYNLLQKFKEVWGTEPYNFETYSCEQLCSVTHQFLVDQYPSLQQVQLKISVFEDNENGAVVVFY